MTTLYDILLDLYDDLGELRSGVATGGGADRLVDTVLKPHNTDAFKYGALFITETSDGAAPQGEFAEVTGFTPSSGTLDTESGVFTANPAAGDHYALTDDTYPLNDVIRLVNRALRKLGPLPQTDTSLSTEAGKTEYALPAGVRPGKLRRVYIAQATDDADDNLWREKDDWRIMPGRSNDLLFRSQPLAGRTMLLVYMGDHSRVSDPSDTILSVVEPDLLVSEARYRALKWRRQNTGDETLNGDINDAAAELEMARKKHKVLDPGEPFKPIMTPNSSRGNKYGSWIPGN